MLAFPLPSLQPSRRVAAKGSAPRAMAAPAEDSEEGSGSGDDAAAKATDVADEPCLAAVQLGDAAAAVEPAPAASPMQAAAATARGVVAALLPAALWPSSPRATAAADESRVRSPPTAASAGGDAAAAARRAARAVSDLAGGATNADALP